MNQSRRQFLNHLGLTAAGLSMSSLLPTSTFAETDTKKFSFDISLAEFSLDRKSVV